MKISNPRFLKSLELLSSTEIFSGLKIIELGCGEAELISYLGAMLGAGELVGVDIDDEKLAKAQKHGVKVVRADLNKDRIPFPDEFFDIVVMEEVIEHLVDPDNAIREVWRILKPGGYFLISTPNLAWWVNRLTLMLGYQPYWTECSTKYNVGKLGRPHDEPLSGHLRLYTYKALKDLLKIYGFRIVSSKGVSYSNLPSVLKYVDHLLSKVVGLAQIMVILSQK